jgi:hypothetical protein
MQPELAPSVSPKIAAISSLRITRLLRGPSCSSMFERAFNAPTCESNPTRFVERRGYFAVNCARTRFEADVIMLRMGTRKLAGRLQIVGTCAEVSLPPAACFLPNCADFQNTGPD